jgi:predicted DNA-binding protein YlxM (UPF0122 family)
MLKPKQKKCIELMLQGDLQQKQIAALIKVTEQTICNWKRDVPEFMQEYNRLLKQSIQSVASKAFRTQTKLLDAKSEMVRYMVSKDILDRAGFKATDKVEYSAASDFVFNILPASERTDAE